MIKLPDECNLEVKAFPGPLHFDLETVPDFARQELFGLPEPEEYVATDPTTTQEEILEMTIGNLEKYLANMTPSEEWLQGLKTTERLEKNRKGTIDKIDKAIARIGEHDNVVAANNKKMGTTPEFCRIVSMGWACGNGDIKSISSTQEMEGDGYDIEREILKKFWLLVSKCKGAISGYNIAGFDVPVILSRSILLGVEPTKLFDTRPWGTDLVDLMAKRFPKMGAMKLKDLARYYGIPVPAGETDGGSVLPLWQEGNAIKIDEYVKSDVEISRELFNKFKGYYC